MSCDRRTIESLHEYQSCQQCFSNLISDKMFDEMIVIGDMNCDPDGGKFLHELRSMTTLPSFH